MDKNRKIAVIIPVYNQEDLIVRALDSVPTSEDITIYVSDDGSTDNTFAVVRGYATAHPEKRIIALSGHENRGVSTAINRVLDRCVEDYLVLLGSDDYFLPNAFNQITPYLDGTDLVYFSLELNSGEIWKLTPENKKDICGSVKFMRRLFIGDTRCPVEKRWAEDLDFYTQLLAKNPTEKFTGLTLKHYNFPREGSLTQQMLKEKRLNG